MTNELRKLIKTQLMNLKSKHGLNEVSFKNAINSDLFPHVVFYFDRINAQADDYCRFNYKLVIDVWDKGNKAIKCEEITDAVISLFSGNNLPTSEILPTFIFESVNSVLDEDKTIRHNQIIFTVQNYER